MRKTQNGDITFSEMLWRYSPESIEDARPHFEWQDTPEPARNQPKCDRALGLGECRVCTREERMRRRAA